MKYVNLTPHEINIYAAEVDATGKDTKESNLSLSLPPSGETARVSVTPRYYLTVPQPSEVVLYKQVVGDVVGLPDPENDTIFIVSAQVRLAAPYRRDVASPGELKRNEAGQPIGCVGLYVN